MSQSAMLHLVCGKVAAGKSTLCRRLNEAHPSVLIAQDPLMARLFPEMSTVADYLRLVPRLRDAIGPLVVDVLRSGTSIVLDWPANTVASRAWMRGLAEDAGAGATLHLLDTPEELCLTRLAERNAAGTHDYQVSPDEFAELSAYFEPPSDTEGLGIIRYRPD